MQINYGIIVTNKKTQRLVHFCGYESPPTEYDFTSLKAELATDHDLGLTDQVDDLFFIEADEAAVEYFRKETEVQAD